MEPCGTPDAVHLIHSVVINNENTCMDNVSFPVSFKITKIHPTLHIGGSGIAVTLPCECNNVFFYPPPDKKIIKLALTPPPPPDLTSTACKEM